MLFESKLKLRSKIWLLLLYGDSCVGGWLTAYSGEFECSNEPVAFLLVYERRTRK
jgi:hypothetical protein